MDILWVSSPLTDTRGGALTVTKNIISGLQSDNHAYLGSCKYMGKVFEESGGIFVKSFAGFEPVTVLNWLLMPVSFIIGLLQVIKHRNLIQKADRIIVATAHSEVFFTLPWIIWWFKKPVTIMNHTGRCPRSIYKNPFSFVIRWVYDHSKVVFVSKAHKAMWQDHNLIGKKSSVVYNGIKANDFEAKIRANKDTIILGYLGRIEEQKGLDTFFEALENTVYVEPVFVHIGGSGKDEHKYKAWSEKIMKQNPNIIVEWLGQISDIKKFFESINCLIFPSKFESFGLVMIEAWERGIPVISSDIPAFKELKLFADKLEQGLVFTSENSRQLHTKIALFIKQKDTFRSSQNQINLHNIIKEQFLLESSIIQIKKILS